MLVLVFKDRVDFKIEDSLDKDKEVASFMRRKNKRGEDRITAVVRIKGSP